MSKRLTGMGFCLIAAFLYSTRYIAAAIFGSGVSNWNARLFSAMLEYVGNELVILSFVSLMIGLGYLVWAEFDNNDKI